MEISWDSFITIYTKYPCVVCSCIFMVMYWEMINDNSRIPESIIRWKVTLMRRPANYDAGRGTNFNDDWESRNGIYTNWVSGCFAGLWHRKQAAYLGKLHIEQEVTITSVLVTSRLEQTTIFQNAFSWKNIYVYELKFHWCWFLRVQLTTCQHWFW